jgi:hypothetical protein
LEIWINKNIEFPDSEPKDYMIKIFRDVRSLRSKPAHTYFINKWDLGFFKKQKELVRKTYGAVRILRLVFANHRKVKTVEVPDWLSKGRIRTF